MFFTPPLSLKKPRLLPPWGPREISCHPSSPLGGEDSGEGCPYCSRRRLSALSKNGANHTTSTEPSPAEIFTTDNRSVSSQSCRPRAPTRRGISREQTDMRLVPENVALEQSEPSQTRRRCCLRQRSGPPSGTGTF